MRKRLASALIRLARHSIRLAHRIYRPTVTDVTHQFRGVSLVGSDGSRWTIDGVSPERRESRGWE